MSNIEHPFASFVRILGKGKKGSRSLTREEARLAMGMILDEEIRPEQLGAFLMLLRVKEETPDELAGFIEAVRDRFPMPDHFNVALDWSSYAGKKRQLPWFLLVALLLSEQGFNVFMHGSRGHTQGRIYSEDVLSFLGVPIAKDWSEVEQHLGATKFAFMSIDQLCPPLGKIIQLRSILGLRSPVHTLCRLLNPLGAPAAVDGVFHPPYAPMHQKTAQLLGTQNSVTIRGDGGEGESKPDSETELHWVLSGKLSTENWPRLYPKRLLKDEALVLDQLVDFWRGDLEKPYAEGAVLSTLAIVLRLLPGKSQLTTEDLLSEAKTRWGDRNRQRF